MTPEAPRVLVVDPSDTTRAVVAQRLRAQGYVVEETADPATGADMALCAPPAAVVADLWMPGISGVQLCRLLRSEPGTADVGVILCGEGDVRRDRFWAERAGANAYVPKRRTAELVTALAKNVTQRKKDDEFFFQLPGGTIGIRERIARHLDDALFEAVILAEVRNLATCGSFDRLFDLFVQFFSQLTHYRWLAIATNGSEQLAVHHHPLHATTAEAEAREALACNDTPIAARIEDEDAAVGDVVDLPIVHTIPFGNQALGKMAVSCASAADVEEARKLAALVARELGGPIRIASLVEESQRLAATDPLTGLANRRSFTASLEHEIARAERSGTPLSFALLDVDHFKAVNDRHGHAAGDRVLAALGALLRRGRKTDLAARWGGEEFVVAYLDTDGEGAQVAAERLRQAVEEVVVTSERGERIPLTVSIGVTEFRRAEPLEALVDRADRAMYASKTQGRNRVTAGEGDDGSDVVPAASTEPPGTCPPARLAS